MNGSIINVTLETHTIKWKNTWILQIMPNYTLEIYYNFCYCWDKVLVFFISFLVGIKSREKGNVIDYNLSKSNYHEISKLNSMIDKYL